MQQTVGPKASTQYLSKVDLDHTSEPQNIPYSRKSSQNTGVIIQQDQQHEQLQQQQQEVQKEQPKEKSIHEQQKEYFEKEIQNLVQQIKDSLISDKWKETVNKKGFIGYTIQDCNDNDIFNKSVGTIQAPLKDVLNILFDLQNVEKGTILNKYLKSSQQLVQYTPDIKILQNLTSPPIVSDICMITLQGTIKLDETTYIQCVKSVDIPEGVQMKECKKAKIGVCPYQGWLIKQDPNDSQKTNLQFISHIFGDGMPGFIKKSIRNNRGYDLLTQLSEYINKQNKKKK